MVETRARRMNRRSGPGSAPPPSAWRDRLSAGKGRIAGPEEIVDRLGSMTDRQDLERLFDRHVEMSTLVRLMGRQVSRQEIRLLLESPHPEQEIRKLLD
jgi:hypothetical protein